MVRTKEKLRREQTEALASVVPEALLTVILSAWGSQVGGAGVWEHSDAGEETTRAGQAGAEVREPRGGEQGTQVCGLLALGAQRLSLRMWKEPVQGLQADGTRDSQTSVENRG